MNMTILSACPRKLRESSHPFLKSERWNDLDFRHDDIVIATYSKCGTTLVQQIVAQLIFHGDPDVFGMAISPWIETAPGAPEMARAQTHRRFLKTHLPVEELVYSPAAKYISIGRDARDVIWSLHSHFMGFKKRTAESNDGLPMTVTPDIREFYHQFLDGRVEHQLPFWSHVQGWWNAKSAPNLLTLHYADLIADLQGHILKIAAFLEIPLEEATLPVLTSHCSIAHMRKVAAGDEALNRFFERGAEAFINKGTNGRWRDVLTQAEIDRCDQIAARELTPDCATWLRCGGSI
jgi:aryl sulfotransferase